MASSQLFIILAIAVIFILSISAVEFVVGDDKGWTINFDYQTWAKGKVFHVGDKLEIEWGWRSVQVPTRSSQCAQSQWHICGVSRHCEVGNQKFFITVQPQGLAPASSPSPTGAPSSPATVGSGSVYGWKSPVPSPSAEPPYPGTARSGSHHHWNYPPSSSFPSPSAPSPPYPGAGSHSWISRWW